MYFLYGAIGLWTIAQICLWVAFYQTKVSKFAWLGSIISASAMTSLFYFLYQFFFNAVAAVNGLAEQQEGIIMFVNQIARAIAGHIGSGT